MNKEQNKRIRIAQMRNSKQLEKYKNNNTVEQ